MIISKKSSELILIWLIIGVFLSGSVFIAYELDKDNQQKIRDLFEYKQLQILDYIYKTGDIHNIKNYVKNNQPHMGVDINYEKLIHRDSNNNDVFFSRLKGVKEVKANNKTWKLYFYTTPEFDKIIDRKLSVIILLSGIILSVITFLFLWFFRKSRRNAELEVIDRTHKLLVANTELEKFAYRSSHHLSTPLKSTLNLLESMESSLKSKNFSKVREKIDLAKSTVSRLDGLIRDMLVFSSSKKKVGSKSTFDPNIDIKNIISRFSSMENFDRLAIKYNLKFNGKLNAPREHFLLIVENLISNAIKYQNPKQKKPFIKISTSRSNFSFIFTIEDNGLGIPSYLQDRLFKMFERIHPTVSQGSGLGLYIAKETAKVIDAEIFFEELEKGAKFILKLPLN